MHPTIDIFDMHLSSYTLFYVLRVAAVFLYFFFTRKTWLAAGVSMRHAVNMSLLALVFGFVGGRLMSALTRIPGIVQEWSYYSLHTAEIIPQLNSGNVYYGGLILILISVGLYCRKYFVPLQTVCAIAVPTIPLYHAIGRVGCFLAGCCYGIPAEWGVAMGVPYVPRVPVQLIEAFCNAVLFVVLHLLSSRLNNKILLVPIYLASYGVIRFCLEFLRGDAVRGVFILSTSQWISLLMIVAAVLIWKWATRKRSSA